MTKIAKSIGTALLTMTLAAGLAACQKEEGPMEKAGKSVDNAAGKVGDKVEDAGDAVKDATNGDKK
jgi:hypothetical protein